MKIRCAVCGEGHRLVIARYPKQDLTVVTCRTCGHVRRGREEDFGVARAKNPNKDSARSASR